MTLHIPTQHEQEQAILNIVLAFIRNDGRYPHGPTLTLERHDDGTIVINAEINTP